MRSRLAEQPQTSSFRSICRLVVRRARPPSSARPLAKLFVPLFPRTAVYWAADDIPSSRAARLSTAPVNRRRPSFYLRRSVKGREAALREHQVQGARFHSVPLPVSSCSKTTQNFDYVARLFPR